MSSLFGSAAGYNPNSFPSDPKVIPIVDVIGYFFTNFGRMKGAKKTGIPKGCMTALVAWLLRTQTS